MSGRDTSGLLRGLSPDPEAAARSRANLRRGNLQHGTYSEARRAPLEAEHREQLRAAYPDAPDGLINAAATRAAMISLLSAWNEDVGVIHAKGGTAEVSAAARELRLLLAQHEVAIVRLEEAQRTASEGDPQAKLAEYVDGSITADNDQEDADAYA